MFDNQIEQIIAEIDKMLGNLQNMQPDLSVVSVLSSHFNKISESVMPRSRKF